MTTHADSKKLVRARMAETGENYTTALAALAAERGAAEAFWSRTVRIFIGADGRLTSIPEKHRPRIVVLLELLRRFDPERSYTEKEVGEVLRTADDDVAYLRREMCDDSFMTRRDGIHRVAEELAEPGPIVAQDLPVDAAWRFRQAKRRRELRQLE